MSTTQNFSFKKEDSEFRADLGDYREIKVKGADEVRGVRIETGDVWDLDHLITHGLALDGVVFVRKQRILTELNTDRYDKVDLSAFPWRDAGSAGGITGAGQRSAALCVASRRREAGDGVFLPGPHDSITGRVEAVGNNSYQLRIVSDEPEVAEELVEIHYRMVPMVVVGTHLLRMFNKYLQVTEQV